MIITSQDGSRTYGRQELRKVQLKNGKYAIYGMLPNGSGILLGEYRSSARADAIIHELVYWMAKPRGKVYWMPRD